MKTRQPFFIVRLGIIFILFLNISESNSQAFYDWSDRVPLTDSVSDNTNPYLNHLYDNDGLQHINIAWEHSSDSTATAIYYQNLLSPDGPQVALSDPGIHYTHPKLVDIGSSDTLFYLFYESDQNGNQDIYYVKYIADGTFTSPLPLAASNEDEKNFCSGNESMWSNATERTWIINTLAWTRDGTLVTSDVEKNGNAISFAEPVVIDTNDCSGIFMPYENQVYWIREEGESSWIYYSTRPYSGNWSEPIIYFDERNCFNLSGDKIAGQYLCWTSQVDSVWKMYIGNTYYYSPDVYFVEPEMDEPFDPGICAVVIGVKPSRQQIGELYLTYPFPENNHDEIFMDDYPYDPGFWNFTNSNTDNRNPDFYLGEDIEWAPGCFYVYLVWESYRNDHWQIFDAKTIMCIGGIDENAKKVSYIKTYPNPFSNDLNITYTLSDADIVKVEINDLFGRTITELFHGKQSRGDQQIQWDGRDNGGNEVPPGLYMIRLTEEAGCFSARVIKAE
jgi:hypothetical protein